MSWQRPNWSMTMSVWCHTTTGKQIKVTQALHIWNPCMHFLVEMTQNLYKEYNGTEKIICVRNFKNNVIDVWINKTKNKWFNLLVMHVVESWPVAYHITVWDSKKGSPLPLHLVKCNMLVSNILPKMDFVWVRNFFYLVVSGYDNWRSTLGWMKDMRYHAQDYNNTVHPPIFLDVG